MVLKSRNMAESSDITPKELFRTMIIWLVDSEGHKMTTIEKKTGIDYNKIANVRKGGSSGNKELMEKLVKAYPELKERFKPSTELIGSQPVPTDRVAKLEKEIEILKKENADIHKILLKLTSKMLDDKE